MPPVSRQSVSPCRRSAVSSQPKPEVVAGRTGMAPAYAYQIMHTSRLLVFRPAALLSALALFLALPAAAQDKKAEKPAVQYFEPDFPFQMACINANYPSNNTAMKGVAIRVGNDSTMLFDTDLCRMAAGWTGGFISGRGVVF